MTGSGKVKATKKTNAQVRLILRALQLEDAAIKLSPFAGRIVWLFRKLGGLDTRKCSRYFRNSTVRRLHIGCGGHTLAGWLNVDLYPLSLDVLHLDAARAFPFGDGMFDAIFSEHMIEHVTYQKGAVMLSECHRVLKKGGRIRLSTPDLAFLSALSREDRSETETEYIKWATGTLIQGASYPHATFVINHFVRSWGHQFIYDENVLTDALRRAGFSAVVRCALNESAEPALRNLENEQRMPEGFLRLETMTLEATKE